MYTKERSEDEAHHLEVGPEHDGPVGDEAVVVDVVRDSDGGDHCEAEADEDSWPDPHGKEDDTLTKSDQDKWSDTQDECQSNRKAIDESNHPSEWSAKSRSDWVIFWPLNVIVGDNDGLFQQKHCLCDSGPIVLSKIGVDIGFRIFGAILLSLVFYLDT